MDLLFLTYQYIKKNIENYGMFDYIQNKAEDKVNDIINDKINRCKTDTKEKIKNTWIKFRKTIIIVGITYCLIYLMFGSLAAYLSWRCNTRNNLSMAAKVFYAICAFCFSTIYLAYYLLIRYDSCGITYKKKK